MRDIVQRPGEMREFEIEVPAPEKWGEGLVAVPQGDPIEIVRQPGHGVTIASWFAAADEAQAVTLEQSEQSGAVVLAPEIHESIKQLRRKRPV